MDKPSLKSTIINELYELSVPSAAAQDSILQILTPSGLIMGTPYYVEINAQTGEETKHSSALCDHVLDIVKKYKSENSVSKNDGFIMLKNAKNVTLNTQAATYTFPELIVFFDQIIGITWVSIKAI